MAVVVLLSAVQVAARQGSSSSPVAAYGVAVGVRGLECGAVEGLGCGSKLAPGMARIERQAGVESSWTDRSGTRLVVFFRDPAPPDERAASSIAAALGSGYRVEALSSEEARAAIAACRARAPGWFRRAETIAISAEEAASLAARAAKGAVEGAGLDPAEAGRLEAAVREACLGVFRAHAARDTYDADALHEDLCDAVARAIAGLSLPPEVTARLEAAIEARRRAPKQCPDPCPSR
jgi:hypothetical protein